MATRDVRLDKGNHLFIFRYEEGEENKVLDALVETVNRPDLSFDWFDAACLSHQIGVRVAEQLKPFLPKQP